jgi:mannitol/fructose-specific phosphotransferase system IIA component (Ntr-type)
VNNKDQLFEEIGNSFDIGEENEFDVEEALWDRESLQNTYIEDGVAFPHAIDDAISDTQFCLVILENPVPYTENGEEVSLCGVTIGPSAERERHLKIIRKLSRVFVNEDLQKDLSDVSDSSKGLEVISRYL